MTGTYRNPEATIDAIDLEMQREKDPIELSRLHTLRAATLAVLNREGESIRDYLIALESSPNNSKRGEIEAMISLGLLKTGDRNSALWWAMAGTEHSPDSTETQFVLAFNCYCTEFYSVAIAAAQRALTLDPNCSRALKLLGKCYREEGELENSVRVLRDYVAQCPTDPKGLYELAWSTDLLTGLNGGSAKAIQLYRKALELNPPEWLRVRINRRLGEIEEFEGQP
jgi:tetratricopeptide (TPR) repeat protein